MEQSFVILFLKKAFIIFLFEGKNKKSPKIFTTFPARIQKFKQKKIQAHYRLLEIIILKYPSNHLL
jgi:hypothetical protein